MNFFHDRNFHRDSPFQLTRKPLTLLHENAEKTHIKTAFFFEKFTRILAR